MLFDICVNDLFRIDYYFFPGKLKVLSRGVCELFGDIFFGADFALVGKIKVLSSVAVDLYM